MCAMRTNVENDAQEPEVLVQPIGTLHVAALKADMTELGRRVRKKQKAPVFVRPVVRGKLGEIIAPPGRPALRELKLQPAHHSPAPHRIVRRDVMVAPKDLVLP